MKKKNQVDKNHQVEHNTGCTGMSRRNLLKTAGVAIAGMAIPLKLTSCYDGTNGEADNSALNASMLVGGDTAENAILLPKPAAPVGTATVGIARNLLSTELMVRKAIELAGGLGDIKAGDTVCIKPNITGPYVPIVLNHRIYTDPKVLRAVIRAVKDRTAAKNITVAEATAFNLNTKLWAWETGHIAVCNDEGVNFVGWETGDYTYVFSKEWKYIEKPLRMPTCLLDGTFKHFIGVPFLKNHEMVPGTDVDYTCCIKQHVGVCNPIDRIGGQGLFDTTSTPAYLLGIHSKYLGEIAAELHLMVPKHTMDIVDATDCILTGGPALVNMTVGHPNVVIASRDTVAADSLAVAILRYHASITKNVNTGELIDKPYVNKSVWAQAQIVRAQQLNLGRIKSKIVVKQSGVLEMSKILAKWS
jgi:uncharacterized protein (DUF362 family)